MSEAAKEPERIWVKPANAEEETAGYWVAVDDMGGAEYIRADLVQAKDAEIAKLRAELEVAVAKAWKMGRDASVQLLQEAVDDWRSTGNELPARKIEDEIPAIRALTPPDDPAAKIGGDA